MSTPGGGDPSGTEKLKFKIVFLGNQSVGKTSMIHRFIYDSFDDNYQATIGIDFMSQKVYVEDKIIVLNLWDTAGQESFKSITKIFYRGAHCIFLAYDITRLETFNNLATWYNEVMAQSEPDVILFLVGNKKDKEEEREVT